MGVNIYEEYVASKGATLLVVGYPIAEYEYTPPKEKYIDFQKELARQLDCPVISDYIDGERQVQRNWNKVMCS